MNETIEERVGRRAPKQQKNVRLTRLARERLADLVEGSGRSEAVLIDDAIVEYFRHHPEFWPDRYFPGWAELAKNNEVDHGSDGGKTE